MQQYPPDQPQQSYPPNQTPWQPAQPTPPPPPYQQQPYPQYGIPTPPQPPKKKRRIWLWIVGLVLVLIVIGAIASAANGGNQNAPATSTTPTSVAQSSQPPSATQAPAATPTPAGNKIGQPVSLDGWVVTVNSVKVSPGGGFNTPQKAGDIFLMVDVTIRNGTGQSQSVSSLGQFSLKDATGQVYTETIDTDAPNPPDGTLATGGKLRGTLVYEVPKSMHQFEFDFQPDPVSNDQTSWQLSV